MCGYDFHRQKPIDECIVDFFCHELMLAIELDGLSHQWEEVAIKDDEKQRSLEKLGIYVLRFDDREVITDIENVLRAIEGYILNYEDEHKGKNVTSDNKQPHTP